MDAWLDRLKRDIEDTTRALRDADWSRAPAERWNSAEIIEHMGRTYGTTAKMLELSLEAGGPPQVRTGKVAEILKKLVVVKLGIFPSGAKSPAMVMPKGIDPGPVARERALVSLVRMEKAIAAAEARWGSEEPIAMHPILGPLKAGQWRKFHYVHGRHHLEQVRNRVEAKSAQ